MTSGSNLRLQTWGPFHKSYYEQFLLYEFVEPVLNYGSDEFVALANLCETGPCTNFTMFCHSIFCVSFVENNVMRKQQEYEWTCTVSQNTKENISNPFRF